MTQNYRDYEKGINNMFQCPICSKQLEDMDVPEFYCKYCGNKIVRDVLPPNARNRGIISLSKDPATNIPQVVQASNNAISASSSQSDTIVPYINQTNTIKNSISLPGFLTVSTSFIILGTLIYNLNEVVSPALISLGAIGLFSSIFIAMKHASDKEELKLQMTVDQILIDIKNHDYLSAKLKADTLHYSGSWSFKIARKWNKTRELIMNHISESEQKNND